MLRRAKLNTESGRADLALLDVKEAHHISPGNQNVAAVVQMLQRRAVKSQSDDFDVLLPQFIDGNREAGKALANALLDQSFALRFIEGGLLSELLEKRGSMDKSILGDILLSVSMNASADVSKRLIANVSSGLEKNIAGFLATGSTGIEAFTNILLQSWTDDTLQKQATRTFTTQLVQQLGTTKNETTKIAQLDAILRIVTSKHSLEPKDNQLPFSLIFPLLSSQNPQPIRSRAVVLLSTLVSQEEPNSPLLTTLKTQLSDFITKRLSESSSGESIAACSVLTAVFPICVGVAADVFLQEGLIEEVVQDALDSDDEAVPKATLELLSSATADKKCRTKITEIASEYLQDCNQSTDSATRALAALVLAKLATASMDLKIPEINLLQIFNDAYLAKNDAAIQSAVEGLAFASTAARTKEELAGDPIFIPSILAILKSPGRQHPLLYGCLSILVNVTTYRPPLTEEETRINEIRKFAKDSNVSTPDKLDDNVHVASRCKAVLAAGLLPALSAISINSSPACISAIAQILLSVATAPTNRGLLAQQGAVKLILGLLAKGIDAGTETTLSHAMGKILISVNPTLIFSSRTPITAPIQPLTALLSNESLPNDLPRFESLLALTNLASAPENTARTAIVEKAWSTTESLLLTENRLIARAATELVCNLVCCQVGAEKFFPSKSTGAVGRLHLLLALADVEDLATRRAAGGALAMLTDFGEVCESVGEVDRGIERVGRMVGDEDEDCVFRGVICVKNLVDAGGDEIKKRFLDMAVSKKLQGVVQKTKNERLKRICDEVLKKLQ